MHVQRACCVCKQNRLNLCNSSETTEGLNENTHCNTGKALTINFYMVTRGIG